MFVKYRYLFADILITWKLYKYIHLYITNPVMIIICDFPIITSPDTNLIYTNSYIVTFAHHFKGLVFPITSVEMHFFPRD